MPSTTSRPEIKVAPETELNSIAKSTNTNQAATKSTEENELQQQLTKTIDEFGLNKDVNIKVTQGYAQLEIQDNVLFNSSEADLNGFWRSLAKASYALIKTIGRPDSD